jgi:hypothetical protein
VLPESTITFAAVLSVDVPTAATYGKGIYQESIALVAPGCAEALVEEIASRIGSGEQERADE